jgi:hypothetical protein
LAHEPGKLNEAMTEHKLNWRSFDGDDTINRTWNNPATPTYYIIDAQGTIRNRWIGKVGNKPIDSALEKIIGEAEESVK